MATWGVSPLGFTHVYHSGRGWHGSGACCHCNRLGCHGNIWHSAHVAKMAVTWHVTHVTGLGDLPWYRRSPIFPYYGCLHKILKFYEENLVGKIIRLLFLEMLLLILEPSIVILDFLIFSDFGRGRTFPCSCPCWQLLYLLENVYYSIIFIASTVLLEDLYSFFIRLNGRSFAVRFLTHSLITKIYSKVQLQNIDWYTHISFIYRLWFR